MRTITSSEIHAKIEALEALNAELGRDFDQAASDAVGGDTEASKRAAEIDHRLDRLGVDRKILSRALDRALAAEADVIAKAEVARRRRAYDAARDEAGTLVGLADRIDDQVDALLALLVEIATVEKSVRAHLYAAGRGVDAGRVGQRDLAQFPRDRIAAALSGRAYDKTERRAGYWARVGWRELLETVDD